MTDAQADQATEPDAVPELPITFEGREMWVRMPSPEQLLVWRRTLTHLGQTAESDWTGESVMAALERLRKIVDSTLVNKADVTWLDDGFLDGTLSFRKITPIITLTVDAFADAAGAADNRETKRAAKKTPAKKARRKAPSA